jgi:hypothetical protein
LPRPRHHKTTRHTPRLHPRHPSTCRVRRTSPANTFDRTLEKTDRKEAYDPNEFASRTEMRSFVCGQCHVEYYCSSAMPLESPWSKGLTVEATEQHWNEKTFADGSRFFDYKHKETGAEILKAQHPESPLCWTSKSTTKLARERTAMGHSVSQRSVWNLLDELGYSMQSNRKSNEGANHPDRDAQFQFISDSVATFLEAGLPAISVDTKKKELIGNYKNGSSEWEIKGNPQKVNTYDFADKELGEIAPYGVYDIAQNKGWINVGRSKDTAEFPLKSIRRWWHAMGCAIYADADRLLITPDGGGSNGSLVRLREIKTYFRGSLLLRMTDTGNGCWLKVRL